MDLDAAYANAEFISNAAEFPPRWAAEGSAFRATMTDAARCELDLSYGEGTRERYDLFRPSGDPIGLVVFIHGGYWRRFGKSDWSYFAAGALASGWAVAVPGYPLCPDVRVSEITVCMVAALEAAAAQVHGPIRLTGHSAGGHLVARMPQMELAAETQGRIEKIVPISPVADLRPLLRTKMNTDLRLDASEAQSESPVLAPAPDCPVDVWVGAEERPAFLDQARWLVEAWDAECHIAPGLHHFNVIDGLRDADSPLMRSLLG